jgi:hypothetical protein
MQQLILLSVIIVVIYVILKRGKSSIVTFWYNLSRIVTLISVIFSVYIIADKHEMLQRAGLGPVISYSIGAIFGASIIPLFVWAIYFVLKYAHNNKLLKLKQEKINKINSSDEYSQEFQNKLSALKDLLDVQVISPQEFETKKKLLIRKSEKLVIYAEELNLNQMQIEKLKTALDSGLIGEEEHEVKASKLLSNQLQIKQRFTAAQED